MSSARPDTHAHPTPSQILSAIGWVGRTFWGGLPVLSGPEDCNVYLLRGSEFDVLIDCGFDADVSTLQSNIHHVGGDPDRIREIWLTHSHFDHFMRAAHWAERYPQVRCRISSVAVKFFERGNFRLVGHQIDHAIAEVPIPKNLTPISDGEQLHCPPWRLTAEALPGHTPDMMGFRGMVDGIEVLFSGDAAIGDQRNGLGLIGWLDGLWLSSVPVYRETLARLAKRPPQLLLPGHGEPHFGEAARLSLQHCLERIEQFAAFPNLSTMMSIATRRT